LDLLPFCFLFAGWLACHAIWVLVVLAGHTLFLISTTKVSAEICATENIYTHKDIEELRKAVNLLN